MSREDKESIEPHYDEGQIMRSFASTIYLRYLW